MKKKTSKNTSRKSQAAARRKERLKKRSPSTSTIRMCVGALYEGTPDPVQSVKFWEKEHGASSESRDYLQLVRLRKEDEDAWTARVHYCSNLTRPITAIH